MYLLHVIGVRFTLEDVLLDKLVKPAVLLYLKIRRHQLNIDWYKLYFRRSHTCTKCYKSYDKKNIYTHTLWQQTSRTNIIHQELWNFDIYYQMWCLITQVTSTVLFKNHWYNRDKLTHISRTDHWCVGGSSRYQKVWQFSIVKKNVLKECYLFLRLDLFLVLRAGHFYCFLKIDKHIPFRVI